jgi:putative ABC transport system permease protein
VGPIALLARLVRRNVVRHRWQNVLLLTALTAAATSLVLGFALRGHTSDAYAQTRKATAGPDVVAEALPEPRTSVTTRQREQLSALMHDRSVSGASGPFPTTWTALTFGNIRGTAEVQGRDISPSAVDQPKITSGRWIAPGAAVIEQAFANALGARVGHTLMLGGRPFRVAGIAVTAAATPYPDVCFVGCALGNPTLAAANPGLIWLTRGDARSLATRTEPVALTAYLTLRPGVDADAFVTAHSQESSPSAPILTSRQDIDNHDGKLVRNERTIALLGGSLLSLLAIATVTVLIGTRLTSETRRIGTLKAIGATPAYVTTTLLAETGLLAVIAGAVGAALAWAIAPVFDAPSAGLLGSASATSVTPLAIAAALAVVVGFSALATMIAALRPTRVSTVAALAGFSHRPPRWRTVIAISSRLPTAGLIALRLIARRPRRSLLTAAGVAVAVTGTVAVLLANAHLNAEHAHVDGGLADPNTERLDHLMLALTVLLLTLAVLNIAFVATATALDAQTSLAVLQVLGCTPAGTLGSIATALAAPALLGTVVGLPAGLGLFAALQTDSTAPSYPVTELGITLIVVVVASAGIAALAARLSARRPIAQVLQSADA